MKRKVLSVMLCAAMVVSMTACGGSDAKENTASANASVSETEQGEATEQDAQEEEPITCTLTVWSPSEDQDPEYGQWLNTMCDQFNELHPNWDITFNYGVCTESDAKKLVPQDIDAAADVFIYLYFEEMNIDPKDPKKADRDRFVLSKGHTAPGYYSALAERGFFPKEDLKTLRHLGSYLQGHPDMKHIPGVDMSSGSLGQGISAAVGMALSAKLSNESYRVYTLLGDGEIQEGQVWEAAMFAGFRKLDNLVVIVDNNGLQIDGKVDEVCSPYPIDKKFEAFNFHVINVADGNDMDQLRAAFDEAKATKGMPTAIIMKTVKGKGVSFMENQVGWHGKAPNDEQYAQAMEELEKAGEALCQK